MPEMPMPTTQRGQLLVQAVWDLFFASGRWPFVRDVARRLDRLHDVLLEDALQGVPRELLYGVDPKSVVSDNVRLGLSVVGAAAASGTREDLAAFFAAVRLAAEVDRSWVPPSGMEESQPQLTAEDLVRAIPLPAAGREPLVSRVGTLLRGENWGWAAASGEENTAEWMFVIDRRVRAYRNVMDVADYWARSHPSPSSQPDAATTQFGNPTEEPAMTPQRSSTAPRTVFLVHGRDLSVRDSLIELLRAFDLRVVNWREAASSAGGGTPYTGDIVRAGMEMADAVVVLLTPDDVGYVRPIFRQERDGRDELQPTGQARLNVVFEAGMAMMRDRERVVLVEVGTTRSLSDTAGLNVVRLRDDVEVRKDLAARLRAAGLSVDTDSETWRYAGRFDRPAESLADLSLSTADGAGFAGSASEHKVLRHLASHFNQLDTHRLDTPFEVPGLEWERVAVALRDLRRSDPPYIEGVMAAQADYPIVVTGLTERGRVAARSDAS